MTSSARSRRLPYRFGTGRRECLRRQKQRLCIARALLKKPKILILDDSTSAVDTVTDSKIREAFRTQIPDTTKIIIAQRISSVEDADKIVVLDGGKLSDVGTHENCSCAARSTARSITASKRAARR